MGRILDENAVLKEIGRWIGYLDEDMIERIKIGIKKLPERKTGEWIEIPDGIFASTYKCSKCGASPVLDEYEWAFSHYCPNCGARMVQKGEGDETD